MIDIDSMSPSELSALENAIAEKRKKIDRLANDIEAVRELVAGRGWESIDAFMHAAGYTSIEHHKKSDAKIRITSNRMTPHAREEMIRSIRESKMTMADIASRYAVSVTTVMTAKRSLGLVKHRSK